MLEKIGLPPKPSMRGGSWVVDASHCQGCSSQFTFINRKHHCRRCGGLFCNSCTQQRMILRGQGDSPVRICSPCKGLEDAARFELRYGHKNRSAKGISKQVQKQEEEILHQIVGADGKQESHTDIISDLLRTSSSASSSSLNEEGFHVDGASRSPEELRRQAVEEKNKYKILKGEGRNEEALQAFKRGKELERQAGALETELRKNRRLASKASNLTSVVSNQKKDESEEFVNKEKNPSRKGKEEKSDLAAELRELGWSDADLHDAERKPVNLSVEGELFNLLGEITQRSSVTKNAGGSDKSQVVALKKKALLLKREGKLAEAKEELKRAKILEKQLEEQELLGDAEDSDDELSALIRSMDDDKRDDPLLNNLPVPNINFGHLLDAGDDLTVDNFDVTDNDMNDPLLAAALKSFGWEEEDDDQATDHLVESNPLDREALQREVLTLKREALSRKHEGNVAQAMSLLKKAKLLENDLNTMQVAVQTFAAEANEENDASIPANEENVMKLPAKSKLMIQKELLALKKKALALRRGGRVEEADEELRKGKALEQQLEAMENVPKRPAPKVGTKNPEIPGALDLGKDEVEAEVTEQDMHDPALMLVLKNLGWNDDDAESANMKNSKLHEIPPKLPRRSKADIQRELLGLKRKALALRRQGKTEEADAELERAKVLEEQLADMEASSNSCSIAVEASDPVHSVSQSKSDSLRKADADSPSLLLGLKLEDLKTDLKTDNFPDDKFSPAIAPIQHNSQISGQQNNESECDASPEAVSPEENTAQGVDAQRGKVLAHKRKAVALKREGKLAEAREELRRAKLLESNLEGGNVESKASVSTSKATSTVQESRAREQVQKPPPGRDRFKMQQESLSHKRNALKLRREGKIEESEAELELARALESQLEDSTNANVGNVEGTDGVGVEDFLDPQLTAALKSIGWQESDMGAQSSKKSEPKTSGDKGEKVHLEEMIKSERGRALALKREGKQAEALEALRSAKRLEKKLVSLT